MAEQVFINEVKCNFNLRQPKSEHPTNIYLVVRINNKQVKLATGVKVYPDHWNVKKQEAYVSVRLTELDNRNNVIANNKLTELKVSFIEYKHYLCEHPNELDKGIQLLNKYIYKDTMRKQEEEVNAIHWLNKALAEDRTIKDSSKMDYVRQVRGFEVFLKEIGKYPIGFKGINLALLKDYETYLFNKEVESGKTTKTSTVGNKVEKMIAIIKRAEPYELIDVHEAKLDRYKKPTVKEDGDNEIYLTEEEIGTMYKLSLKGKEEQARDLFILACWTGQRFSDIMNLNTAIVKDISNGKVLDIVQTKKNHKVNIPLLPVALEILSKYDFKLPSIDQATMLKYIKLSGQKAGITRLHNVTDDRGGNVITERIEAYNLIGTHTARRSYISNMLKRGYDSHILMKITGHTTEIAFKKYAKLTSEDAANTILGIEANRIEQPNNESISIQLEEVSKPKQNIKVLDYLLAETSLLRLNGLQQQGINIYDLVETKEAINVIKDSKRTNRTKEFLNGIDKSQLYERVNILGGILWNIAKYSLDFTLYQMYEQKVIELGLAEDLNEVTDQEIISQLWAQEYANEERETNIISQPTD